MNRSIEARLARLEQRKEIRPVCSNYTEAQYQNSMDALAEALGDSLGIEPGLLRWHYRRPWPG